MRRKARECALRLIYQLDMHGVLTDGRVEPTEVDEPIRAFWASFDSVTKDEQGLLSESSRAFLAIARG